MNDAKVLVKFNGDTKNLDDATGKAKKGLGSFKGFAKGIGASVAAIAATAAAAATSMLVDITKQSLKARADLEQNLGGVETLFGKDADKVVANAKKAFQTAGVSANEYMQGVTSFSASLLQSLSGDTSKAADVADMAFRDMSDNANKFGSSMESIQNAYQGFAKQNYTMLDNLKLGYGGTKTEMERLISDASKLKDEQKKLNVTFNEDMSLSDIDANVVPVFNNITKDGAVQVQKVAGTNEVIFKTRELAREERQALEEALVAEFGVNKELITAETISSTVSGEMKRDAIEAVILATICMLIYIWFRFKDIRFATSSVVALVHDVLVVLAFYAISKVSVGSTFIACMLTIVGYSINATIVIFDRVRENMAEMTRKETLKDVVNKSITQTLSRSIFTSLTTFIMVAALYVLGVTSIREFALPLMVGILCGTYSSICIAGGLWHALREKFPPRPEEDE